MRLRLLLLMLCMASASPALADTQTERLAFLDRLVAIGVLSEHAPDGASAHVTVTALFHDSDFDTKVGIAEIAFAYYGTENPNLVQLAIIDYGTGMQIGYYAGGDLVLY